MNELLSVHHPLFRIHHCLSSTAAGATGDVASVHVGAKGLVVAELLLRSGRQTRAFARGAGGLVARSADR